MNLLRLREAVDERTVVTIFTRLVNATNQAAEHFATDAKQDESFFSDLNTISRSLSSLQKRIARLNISENIWQSMGDAVSSRIEGDRSQTWIEVRSLLTRELIPKAVASLNHVVKNKLGKDDIQFTAAKERINNLQNLVIGLAPSTGMPEDDGLGDDQSSLEDMPPEANTPPESGPPAEDTSPENDQKS